MKNQSISISKILITLVALWSAGGSYIFDWNHTHIYNSHWPPHAKFHNAQTMLLGTCLGLLSLCVLWIQELDQKIKIRMAIILASFYWLTQIGATLFPGTALTDPEFAYPGEPPHQLIVDMVMLLLLGLAFFLGTRNFNREEANK